MITFNRTYPRNGSAWHTWQIAGKQWRETTNATTSGALALAAACYASGATGDNERNARKRAFIEGATNPAGIPPID